MPRISDPIKKNYETANGIERGKAFWFNTPSSILVVGPSGCGKPCFTESLLLDHFGKNCLGTLRPRLIIATGRGKMDSEP